MIPLKFNSALEDSSKNHADYLAANRRSSHQQNRGYRHFTGKTPADRAVYTGYLSRSVLENLSSGQKNIQRSVEGLMGAIYHRFGFLDFTIDEIGIGVSRNRNTKYFVFNMGNERLNQFCRHAPSVSRGAYVAHACQHVEKVSAKKFRKINQDTEQKNPPLVLWPPPMSEEIPTTFYEETPDPLPDRSVSGYPISIQFNPYYFKKVKLKRFKLFNADYGNEIRPTRLLNSRRDVNRKFTDLQFALFPLKPLQWGTYYRVEITAIANGKTFEKQWFFRTQDAAKSLFLIKGKDESLQVQARKQYSIHLPPQGYLPIIENLKWQSTGKLKVSVDWQDKNTILVKLQGDQCERADFSLNGNRRFSVQIAERDNLREDHFYPMQARTPCLLPIQKKLSGFRVKARGEQLKMRSGQDYWVEINLRNELIGQLNARYPRNVQIKVQQITPNLFRIRLTGPAREKVDFQLPQRRRFSVTLTK